MLYSLIGISLPLVIPFIAIMSVLQHDVLGFYFYKLNIHLTGKKVIDLTLEGLILFFMPILAFNYYLIFYKKKYVGLLEEYNSRGRNFFLYYMVFSYGLIVVLGVALLLYLNSLK